MTRKDQENTLSTEKGVPVVGERWSTPSKWRPILTLNLLDPITLPEKFDFLEIGTCKFKGLLYTEGVVSHSTEI